MANNTSKKVKISVGVDDTLESVLELLEGMEEIDISFKPGVFFELPDEVKDKLTRRSLEHYAVCKQCQEIDERVAKQTGPRIQVMPKKLEFGEGGAIARKMQMPKDDKKFHYAILDGMDYDTALEQGYVPFDGKVAENNVIKNTNKRTKEEEELVKLKIPIERYREHMAAVSNESRRIIRSHEGLDIDNTEIEIRRDKRPIGIFEKGNEGSGK